jgi:intracellular sulfur oxidation DsrE/DsrF family protein
MAKTEMNQIQRRSFVKKLTGSIAFLGLSGTFLNANTIATVTVTNKVNTPAYEKENPDEWFAQLKGKHKILLDVPAHKGGSFLTFARNFLETNNETGTSDEDLNVLVILRHFGIALGLNDSMWEKYKIGDYVKLNDAETKEPSLRNVFWKPKSSDAWPGNKSISSLQKRGIIICVCDKSVEGFAEDFSHTTKFKKSEIISDLYANMIPDVKIVPSGVWALGRAQEQGCGYCFAG